MANQAVFTMGLPGAGKSTVSLQRFPNHRVIDPDAFKQAHPDYDPKNPSVLHEWSKQKAAAEFAEALLERVDIVVDGTGTNYAPLIKKMRQAAAAGYETVVFYVSVPLNVALERNQKRERTVPEEIIRDKAEAIEIAFEIVAREADHAIAVDNA